MTTTPATVYSATQLWKVLVLFLVPIGGGIPGGVLLAKNYGFAWPVMMFLYFISDVILAIVFEPLLLLFIAAGKRISSLARLGEAFKLALKKTTEHYGNSTGPFALILIAFGVDPMTGRAVAVAAGHGFIVGWMIAIAGDMLYFTLLMVSTLWLNNILGDGTWTTLIILALMILVPIIIRRFRKEKIEENTMD
jgi:uncharacterized membrane protein